MEKTNIFKCKPPEVHFTIRNRVPYNKLLTNLACSSRTGEYWPSRSVSKRLLLFIQSIYRFLLVETTRIIHHNQLLFTKFGKNLRHIESMTSKVQPAADSTSFPGSLFSASLSRWNRDPGCGWSRDHPESGW